MVWLEVVGWLGSAVLVWSLAQTRVLRFRALNLGASLVLTGYNAVLGIWPMVAMNGVIAGINVVHLVRLLRTRDDEDTYQVLPVGPGEAYLRHVLHLHTEDIERHNPGFAWDGARPGRSAFLVVRGEETVGVVLLSDAGGQRARVELDYVLPRFRDFSVGKFVYRRGGLLSDLGYRHLLAPTERMVDARDYFPRVGFRRDGEALVLDVA
jgi:hypothetical protein